MSSPAAAARDRFAEIVRAHHDALQAYARKLAGDPHEANDLVQDALERALRSFDRFDPATNARAWLCTILYNAFIDRIRKRKIEATGAPVDEMPANEPFVPPRWTAITPEQLRSAIDELEDDFRVVCQLRLVERLSYVAIAARLGVPRNTVATRLLRGRDKLKALLERHLEGAR